MKVYRWSSPGEVGINYVRYASGFCVAPLFLSFSLFKHDSSKLIKERKLLSLLCLFIMALESIILIVLLQFHKNLIITLESCLFRDIHDKV